MRGPAQGVGGGRSKRYRGELERGVETAPPSSVSSSVIFCTPRKSVLRAVALQGLAGEQLRKVPGQKKPQLVRSSSIS